jgi:tRNA/tmRNA/rRNA uracil-C5-methylase (TrmA/RlmC/RlmD family)
MKTHQRAGDERRALGPVVGPVEVGQVAHGGHCVARHEGRVLFVRHALPGEQVVVRVTDDSHDRFWRGDAVEIRTASPDRVVPPCPVSGPGLCGGCDFQHVDFEAQRELKRAVVAEQLSRLAGLDWFGVVEAAATPGTEDGLHWRTRMRYVVDDEGRAGLRAHRSHRIVPLPAGGCPIAAVGTPDVVGRKWSADSELLAADSSTGGTLIENRRVVRGTRLLVEHAADRDWSVAADGFWQVHPAAADTLADAVRTGLSPAAEERAFDLYCGVGLFAGVLGDAGCQVWGVEGSRSAVERARQNLADLGGRVRLTAGQVEQVLPRLPAQTDLVVLDPPRSGAGRKVMQQITARHPRAVAYVACDPAALARDLATAAAAGYGPTSIRAFDLFPMTHHVECVAVLEPTLPSPSSDDAGG